MNSTVNRVFDQTRRRSIGRLFVGLTLFFCLTAPLAAQFSPVRPPIVPLITRTPYVNTWVTNNVPGSGNWPTFWNGNVKAITLMVSVDSSVYLLMGRPQGIPHNATQTSLTVTPTQSIYVMQCGPVAVNIDFLSPIEANDLRRFSVPLSDIVMTAKSTDGGTHAVRFYADISGEWAHGNNTALIGWKSESIARSSDGSSTPGNLVAWEVTPTSPTVLAESNDYPDWGTAVFATTALGDLTTQSGPDATVRTQFVNQTVLTNGNDTNQPRAINNSWPVFAFCLNAGTVTSAASSPFTLTLGHVRNPAVSYLGASVAPLWASYWSSYQSMLAFQINDAAAELTRSNALDARLNDAAIRVGGSHYAGLLSLALRQAVAGTELVGTAGNPWLMLKEISSDGNVSTVDVSYPAFPAFLYLNPTLVRLLIEPVMAYAESGHWPQAFAEHDLGSSYPNATGHNDGGGENMPVEETADMLIMADAYLQYNLDKSVSTTYAKQHYNILHQWANYLLTVPSGVTNCNALDPQYQNQTDDFTGHIAHSSNLALKAIIAVGAMGQIAAAAGNASDATFYSQQAKNLIGQWVNLSQNSNSTHLLLQYREPANAYSPDTTGEPDTAWSLKYNAFPDKMLGLNLIPSSVMAEEASWYASNEQAYGVQLDYRNGYTKIDWELFTAAATDSASLRQTLIDETFNYANTTPSAVPLSDWYEPGTGVSNGFQARPVVGGLFAPLVRKAGAFPNPNLTYRIVNQFNGLVVAVDSQSTANGAVVTQWNDNGTPDHNWSFKTTSNGSYRLANQNSGKVLTPLGWNTANGAGITQWDDNGTTDHLWQLSPNLDGTFRLFNPMSGKVLTPTGWSTVLGNPLTQWDDNGTNDHNWSFWPNF